MRGKGMPIMTFIRGKLIYQEGEILGKPGYGKFQRPI
jgi:dihydropyrimidinase